MTVKELKELLSCIDAEDADVYVNATNDAMNEVARVVVETDMDSNIVCAILKTQGM